MLNPKLLMKFGNSTSFLYTEMILYSDRMVWTEVQNFFLCGHTCEWKVTIRTVEDLKGQG